MSYYYFVEASRRRKLLRFGHALWCGQVHMCKNYSRIFVAHSPSYSSRYIQFPITCLETTRAKLFFRTSQKTPHAVGAIDETHFEIVALESRFNYFDHQNPYSVIMQAVVGGNLMFLGIVIGYPGSMHNAQVLRNTKQFRKVERFCESRW